MSISSDIMTTQTTIEFTYQESLLFMNGRVLRLFRVQADTGSLFAGLRDFLRCVTGCKGSIEFLVDLLKEYIQQSLAHFLFVRNRGEFMVPVRQFAPMMLILHAVMECDESEREVFDWHQSNAADRYIEYMDQVQNSIQEACRRRDVAKKIYNPSNNSSEHERRSYWVYQRFIGMIQSQRHALKTGQVYTSNMLR